MSQGPSYFRESHNTYILQFSKVVVMDPARCQLRGRVFASSLCCFEIGPRVLGMGLRYSRAVGAKTREAEQLLRLECILA